MTTDLDGLRGALLRWYARVRRDLPWRRTTDPYAILVSEVMLQQTQVARVVPRYLEWIERWPTADALAAASRAEVLAAWVGSATTAARSRCTRAAAAVARDGWPADLRTLPGVGPYTAAAVGSFAFGAQVAAIDTNARRVAERLGHGATPPRCCRPAAPPSGIRRRWSSARRSARRGRRAATRARWRGGARRRRAAVAPRAAPGAAGRALRGHQPLGPRARRGGAARPATGCRRHRRRSDSTARSRAGPRRARPSGGGRLLARLTPRWRSTENPSRAGTSRPRGAATSRPPSTGTWRRSPTRSRSCGGGPRRAARSPARRASRSARSSRRPRPAPPGSARARRPTAREHVARVAAAADGLREPDRRARARA